MMGVAVVMVGGDACLDGLAQGTKVVLLGHEGAGLGEGPKHAILCLVAPVCLEVQFEGAIGVFDLPGLQFKRPKREMSARTRTSRRRARHVYFDDFVLVLAVGSMDLGFQ